MTDLEKKQITEEVLRLSNQTSQNRVARRVGVSSATISHIINSNWSLIKAEMWRKIKVKLKIQLDWKTAATTTFQELNSLCAAAQSRSLTVAISHKAGTGKTQLFNHYQKTESNVLYIEGNRTMSKKTFIKKLLECAGQENHGTTEELIEQFINHVSELEQPLIILDQFDKLKDGAFDLFMDFYNDLYGNCGFVISGVAALKKRILLGVQRNKIGYEEIWSRMNRKFIPISPISQADVKLIFTTNGIKDLDAINESYNSCEGDLRRVRQDIEKYKIIHQ